MAKIYGVELKAVKYFEGREGVGFNSNIYLNNKKIGTFSDYAFGAMEEYDFDSKTTEQQKQELKDIAEKYFQNYPKYLFYPEDKITEFLGELLTLKEREDSYKKNIKKNKDAVLIIGSFHKRTDDFMAVDITKMDEVAVAKFYDKDVIDSYSKKQGFKETSVYKSLDDFIIK